MTGGILKISKKIEILPSRPRPWHSPPADVVLKLFDGEFVAIPVAGEAGVRWIRFLSLQFFLPASSPPFPTFPALFSSASVVFVYESAN